MRVRYYDKPLSLIEKKFERKLFGIFGFPSKLKVYERPKR